MSVAGILSSLFTNTTLQGVSSKKQQFQQEFQQLGQDLQSGNLSAAQSDFATLQKDAPQSATSTSAQSNPIAQEFQQLSQDLQSGNVTAAQQDFTNIQQSFQNAAPQAHHHHHHGGGGQEQSSTQNSVSQLFAELGQDLQSGNQTAALQAYQTLQNSFAPFSTDSTATTALAATA